MGLNALPAHGWLAHAQVPGRLLPPAFGGGGLHRVHLLLREGTIEAVETTLPATDLPVVHLAGRIVTSGFVDLHTHLDKTLTAARIGRAHERLADAVAASGQDRARWTDEDVHRRMTAALQAAWSHGTRALRSHLDWVDEAPPLAWSVAQRVRAEWAGRIALQFGSIRPLPLFADLQAGETLARSLAEQGGFLGASVHPVPDQRALLQRVFELAVQYGLPLDFHADEHVQPDVRGTRTIAELTLRHGLEGRVVCGHCCSLNAVDPKEREGLLALMARAGITLVGLPLANLQLQPRASRALAPLREAAAAGVRVALASDNVRDAFVPVGDYDLCEVLRIGSLVGHLHDPLVQWIDTITRTPAAAMGLAWDGVIRPGAAGRLVLFDAADPFAALARTTRFVSR